MKYVFKKRINVTLATIFDAAGGLLFSFARQLTHKYPLNFNSVLLIRLDHIGDVLLATALPKIIKENFPKIKVFFLTSTTGKQLLDQNPFVDEVIVYNPPWFGQKKPSEKGYLSFFEVARILKQKKIDVSIGSRGDVRENILMWLAKIPNRIGYGITGGGFLLTSEIPYREGLHESEHAADLLQPLGIQAPLFKPQLYFLLEEEKLLELKFVEWGVLANQKLVGFQVDAGTEAKQWPVEHVRDFLKSFSTKFPTYKVVLIGNEDRGIWFRQGFTEADGYLNLMGKTSLRELCVLMKRFACFIGPDSGPTHIAASLGVPTIFLYSGTNIFEQWKPLFENARVLRHEVSCSPCGLRVCNVQGHPCVTKIGPEQVIKVLETVIQ